MAVCPRCGEQHPDGFRFCPGCGAALGAAAPPGRDVRKVVTVVFCDLVGSTEIGARLDPEVLREVMAGYFDAMRHQVEVHGGRVEKFVGDAVLAVFGVPVLHEDDALRAVRAAVAMRAELPALNATVGALHGIEFATRMGVGTGGVVVGMGDEVLLGDVLNTAARLEQAAAPGELLIGAETYELVQHAIQAESLEPLPVKGKHEPVPAWRLIGIDPGAASVARQFDRPLVGRDRELQLLRDTFERAASERRTGVVTVFGLPGMGKSRLGVELARAIGGRARVLVGNCLAYGESITYAPVAQMLSALATDAPSLRSLLEGEPDADRVAGLVAAALGFTEATGGDELLWSVRRLFEAIAAGRPLVLVFEDIHWAEPTLLDLIEYLADWLRNAPLLIVCMARPEFLDRRPTWGAGRMNATSVLLEPLPPADAERMLDARLPANALAPEVRSRIHEVAHGVPLVIEQMLAMVEELHPMRAADIPPAIQALLAARLDSLETGPCALLEHASVEGEQFSVGVLASVSELPAGEVTALLNELERRELVRHDRADGRYRFAHSLIRDAAYDRLSKRQRAGIHERVADILGGLDAADELVAFHLEQAIRLYAGLGDGHDGLRPIVERAGDLLVMAARRADQRDDDTAAVRLLDRAIALRDPDDPERGALLLELAAVLMDTDPQRAGTVVESAIRAAVETDDDQLRWRSIVSRNHLQLVTDPNRTPPESLLAETDEAIAALERTGDVEGVAAGYVVKALIAWIRGHIRDWTALEQRATAIAGSGMTTVGLGWAAWALTDDLTPMPEVEQRTRDLIDAAGENQVARAFVRACLGQVIAMRGGFDEGRKMAEEARDQLESMGRKRWTAEASYVCSTVALLVGDTESAEREAARATRDLDVLGDRNIGACAAAHWGLALCELGRHAEALDLGARYPSIHDVEWASVSNRIKALGAMAAGDGDRALAAADAAVAALEDTELTFLMAQAISDRGRVLAGMGRTSEAREALAASLAIYTRRGMVPAFATRRLEEALA